MCKIDVLPIYLYREVPVVSDCAIVGLILMECKDRGVSSAETTRCQVTVTHHSSDNAEVYFIALFE